MEEEDDSELFVTKTPDLSDKNGGKRNSNPKHCRHLDRAGSPGLSALTVADLARDIRKEKRLAELRVSRGRE